MVVLKSKLRLSKNRGKATLALELHRIFSPMRQGTCELCHLFLFAVCKFRLANSMDVGDGLIYLFVGASIDANIAIGVDMGDRERTFSR